MHNPAITIESLTFSDGTTISLDASDIVVFVGPNNAGKSLALRELEQHVGKTVGKVIKSVTLRKTGDFEDFREIIEAHSRITGEVGNPQLAGSGFSVYRSLLKHYWDNDLSQIRAIFCLRIATETRITDSNPQTGIALLDQVPLHPIHILFKNDRVESNMSGYFRQAFGQGLSVFRLGGTTWPLLVGDLPAMEQGEDRVSASYNQRLRAVTVPLHEQGNGMRSFATVILRMLAPDTLSLLMLDEPEAFLHPPQARLLGEFVVKERPKQAQLFIATHSPDVLQGLLNTARDHLRVIRIQRDGGVNRVKELDKSRASEIARDPVMKFTSTLSGVFHERVIICESDADCMFYSAILELQGVRGEQFPDVLFVQAGGKHRMAMLAETLRSLDVNVDVIADIDVLNDETVLQRLVVALGGTWEAVRNEAIPLKAAIEQHKPWLTAVEIAKGIREILEVVPQSGEFPKNLRGEITALFRKASPWDAVKSAGRSAIPPGDATRQYERLQGLCAEFGLWIVPVGELEGFCKSEGDHGPRWVQNVLANYNLASDPRLAEARGFVKEVWTKGAPS